MVDHAPKAASSRLLTLGILVSVPALALIIWSTAMYLSGHSGVGWLSLVIVDVLVMLTPASMIWVGASRIRHHRQNESAL